MVVEVDKMNVLQGHLIKPNEVVFIQSS